MTPKDTLQSHFSAERLFPPLPDASELLVCVPAHDYSASAIARAVEDCDAHLMNLNVLTDRPADAPGQCLVALRVDHRNVSAVSRSLERYGMRVIPIGGDDDTDASFIDPHEAITRERVDQLIRILEM